MTGRAELVVAATVSAILAIGAAVLRAGLNDTIPLPDRLVAVLVATALLLGALLALPRSAAVTWTLLTLSSGLGAFEVVAVVRTLEPLAVGNGRDLTVLAGASIVAATVLAAAAAARSRGAESRQVRGVLAAVGLGAVATALAAIWAIADPTAQAVAFGTGPTPLRIAARLALVTWVACVLVGLARDLGPAAVRAAARTDDRDANSAGGGLWRYLRRFADELIPGRTSDRRAIVEAERARLAADLHALVLPDLRRAASTAEAAGAPEAMQIDLRRALEDVEQLMLQRQSIVLEQFGLVAALEWLAERTEERSPLRVELELEGEVPDRPNAIDRTVARAAFRIALLALDNVTRHAGATTATLRLAIRSGQLELTIVDNGNAGAGLASPAGRGLADMRSEASASDGSLDTASGPGARIQARWSNAAIAGKPAAPPAHLTDRSGASAP